MNTKIYEYGTAANGLARRLVRDTVVIQEEMDSNPNPSVVVHLRLQTYTVVDAVVTIVENLTAGYKVTKGVVSKDVNGADLPKRDLTGAVLYEEDGVTPLLRDNGYENIIAFQSLAVNSDDILDLGIKEYYGIV